MAIAAGPAPTSPRVLVFAAASLKPALDALRPGIERALSIQVQTSYAGTSALARQIEAGAPAAVFLSADREWMDYLEKGGWIRAETRVDLLRNRLVLVCPANRRLALRIAPGFELRRALGDGRLAIADPVNVPAGRYARAALQSLGAWDAVKDRLAPVENVRAALMLVLRGEVPLGIVYRSDAVSEPGVSTVDVFPETTHAPIVFPAALTRAATGDAPGRVLAFLQGDVAKRVFERYGFETMTGRSVPPHPNPLPLVRGRGNRPRQARYVSVPIEGVLSPMAEADHLRQGYGGPQAQPPPEATAGPPELQRRRKLQRWRKRRPSG